MGRAELRETYAKYKRGEITRDEGAARGFSDREDTR
jgi:hypothetical protein